MQPTGSRPQRAAGPEVAAAEGCTAGPTSCPARPLRLGWLWAVPEAATVRLIHNDGMDVTP